jgi:hypothetical protein
MRNRRADPGGMVPLAGAVVMRAPALERLVTCSRVRVGAKRVSAAV